jgi:hypothetical protein
VVRQAETTPLRPRPALSGRGRKPGKLRGVACSGAGMITDRSPVRATTGRARRPGPPSAWRAPYAGARRLYIAPSYRPEPDGGDPFRGTENRAPVAPSWRSPMARHALVSARSCDGEFRVGENRTRQRDFAAPSITDGNHPRRRALLPHRKEGNRPPLPRGPMIASAAPARPPWLMSRGNSEETSRSWGVSTEEGEGGPRRVARR